VEGAQAPHPGTARGSLGPDHSRPHRSASEHPLRRHQPEPVLGGGRPSLRQAGEPVLEGAASVGVHREASLAIRGARVAPERPRCHERGAKSDRRGRRTDRRGAPRRCANPDPEGASIRAAVRRGAGDRGLPLSVRPASRNDRTAARRPWWIEVVGAAEPERPDGRVPAAGPGGGVQTPQNGRGSGERFAVRTWRAARPTPWPLIRGPWTSPRPGGTSRPKCPRPPAAGTEG
jgi:hypothetical protein